LKQPFWLEGRQCFTSASLGVSLYPEHGGSYETLRCNADTAMYRAKKGAKRQATFFDPAMGQAASARMELEQRLRQAIRDRRFRCAFQPKVDFRSRRVEALDLLDRDLGDDTTISINLAAGQVADLPFMQSFAEAIAVTGRGVHVSIDDFGMGYSSLSVLWDITADEIKVDRSFVTAIHQRPRSQSVLKAISSLGEVLGLTVVAEGVETLEELLYLAAATGIRFAQGYFFAKPMFPEDLVRARINPKLAALEAAASPRVDACVA
jgi:c-di-GMP phosphodiesterase Gmr